MPKKNVRKDKITVITTEEIEGTRSASGVLTRKLEIDINQLSTNVNIFLDQMSGVMTKTPSTVGAFQLAEVEVSAQITGKGQIVLWGIGGEVGAGGGIKFVFKK